MNNSTDDGEARGQSVSGLSLPLAMPMKTMFRRNCPKPREHVPISTRHQQCVKPCVVRRRHTPTGGGGVESQRVDPPGKRLVQSREDR
jgi:hypothetical protein